MSFAKLPLVLAAASSLALTACEAPIQGQGTQNTQQGAIGGAVIGGLLGLAVNADDSNDRVRNAAIGATLGAGVGAIGGNNLDRQEAELRSQLGSNVGIINNGSSLTVTLPQDILFAVDSTTLTGALQNDLFSVAASLNRYPNTTVNVIGHTDNTGAAAYNQDLSQRRAQAVASVLINAGVAPQRIRSIGRGEDAPIASNLTPQGQAQNRRVEIIITPNQ